MEFLCGRSESAHAGADVILVTSESIEDNAVDLEVGFMSCVLCWTAQMLHDSVSPVKLPAPRILLVSSEIHEHKKLKTVTRRNAPVLNLHDLMSQRGTKQNEQTRFLFEVLRARNCCNVVYLLLHGERSAQRVTCSECGVWSVVVFCLVRGTPIYFGANLGGGRSHFERVHLSTRAAAYEKGESPKLLKCVAYRVVQHLHIEQIEQHDNHFVSVLPDRCAGCALTCHASHTVRKSEEKLMA